MPMPYIAYPPCRHIFRIGSPRRRTAGFTASPARLAVLVLLSFALGACSAAGRTSSWSRGLPDPDGHSQAATGTGFVVMALRQAPDGQGFDYSGAGFTPVLLVLKSTGAHQPQVLTEDVRVLAFEGERPPYSPAEAAQLARRRGAFSQKGAAALKDGTLGAALGGGVGALAGLLFGNDRSAVWKGAAVGAAAGAAYALMADRGPSRDQAARDLAADLEARAWREDPLAPGSTRSGYLYLPSHPGLAALRLIVRGREGDALVTLPIVSAEQADSASASRTAGPAPPQPRVAPLDPATGREAQPVSPAKAEESPKREGQAARLGGTGAPQPDKARSPAEKAPPARVDAQEAEDESDEQAPAQANAPRVRQAGQAPRPALGQGESRSARKPGAAPPVSPPPGETVPDNSAPDVQTPDQPVGVTI